MGWIRRGLVLIAIGGASVWVGLWGAGRALGAEAPKAPDRLVVAQRGDLVDTVSASGVLVLSRQETLTFGTAGTLAELLVAEGDRVREGQPLARLDAATQASLRRSVAQARVNLRKAKEALESLQAGPDAKVLAAAESKVANAQVGLDNADRDLILARSDWEAKLDTARQQEEDGGMAYSRLFERYLGITLSATEREQDPGALLMAWGADLGLLFDPWASGDTGFLWLARDPADDPATRWNEMVLYAWRNFYPTRPESATVRAEMDGAWEALARARGSLTTQETQRAKALASAENALARAQQALADAQDDLTTLREPPDPDDATLAEADVAAAQAALETALDRETRATLTAPFTGIVGPLALEEGQTVNANAAIVTIIDPAQAEVQGAVNEVDVARILAGQEVSVTLDALPGMTLSGVVSTVSLVGRAQQGVVSFPVTIRVQAAQGVVLRDGMTASATITASRQSGVILVPPRALRGTLAAPRVEVLANGKREERAVTISGLTTQSAALTSGLEPGDVLVMPASTGTTLTALQGNLRGFGGGPGILVPGGGIGGGRGGRQDR